MSKWMYRKIDMMLAPLVAPFALLLFLVLVLTIAAVVAE